LSSSEALVGGENKTTLPGCLDKSNITKDFPIKQNLSRDVLKLSQIRCDGLCFTYHASQRHSELCAHAVQAFENTLLPAGLQGDSAHIHLPSDTMQVIRNEGYVSEFSRRKRYETEDARVGSDGDKRRHTDLSLAHVGQRLFEMLWRGRGMAQRQPTGISKYKSWRQRVLLRKCLRVDQDNTLKQRFVLAKRHQ